MTNREWLESLSDKEFARLLLILAIKENALCLICCYKDQDCAEQQLNCTDGTSMWLQAEHKE